MDYKSWPSGIRKLTPKCKCRPKSQKTEVTIIFATIFEKFAQAGNTERLSLESHSQTNAYLTKEQEKEKKDMVRPLNSMIRNIPQSINFYFAPKSLRSTFAVNSDQHEQINRHKFCRKNLKASSVQDVNYLVGRNQK